ncbi:unnamed protein product, partial [Menidia menidia]
VSSGQLYELRRALADSVAPGLHTLTGYVKTSITSHYPLITRIDQALTEVSTYANSTRPGPYKRRPLRRGQKPQHSSPLLTFVGFTDPENMVKYFSVDWLAQSHRGDRGAGADPAPTCRPHVACMVQPSAPTFGKSYLQPKPKPSRPAPERAEPFASPHPQNCPSPISETSGYSSGYESEVASSECFSVDEGTEAERDGAQRRVRTKFSPEQISKLEKIFSKHKYLDSGERVKTAQKLNLTETQVRTWFQNRRMKLKREVQDYLAPQLPAVAFRPLPRVHYHPVAEWPTSPYHEERTLRAPEEAFHLKVHCEKEGFAKGSRSQYSPTSPNNSCGYASGSESEVGEDSEGEASAQQRRVRTKFTSEQIGKLERAFTKHRYLGATQRRKIAERLNLSETQHPLLSGQLPGGCGLLRPLRGAPPPASLLHHHHHHHYQPSLLLPPTLLR